jgi:hypothetical protein
MGSCPVVRANEPHTNLCMLYTASFLMFKHWFCWKYQYKKYIFNFIDHVSVCIDRGLSALLWPGPILLIRRPWPYVIHHLHFMNMYRLYIAWYRPILLKYVGCINWYFHNKTLFLWLKRPYFHFTDTGVYRYDNVTLSPILLPATVTNRSHSTYGSSARSDSHRAVFCPNSIVSGWKN